MQHLAPDRRDRLFDRPARSYALRDGGAAEDGVRTGRTGETAAVELAARGERHGRETHPGGGDHRLGEGVAQMPLQVGEQAIVGAPGHEIGGETAPPPLDVGNDGDDRLLDVRVAQERGFDLSSSMRKPRTFTW